MTSPVPSSAVLSLTVTRPIRLLTIGLTRPTISNVTFELERRGAQVLLLLTHAKLPKMYVPTCSAGWHARLDILEQQLQNRPPSSFPALYQSLVPHYEH